MAVQSLKVSFAAGEDRAKIPEVRARRTLERISTLQALVKGLNWIVGREPKSAAEVVSAELIRTCSSIIDTLSEREKERSAIHYAMTTTDSLSRRPLGYLVGPRRVHKIKTSSCQLYDLYFCLPLEIFIYFFS